VSAISEARAFVGTKDAIHEAAGRSGWDSIADKWAREKYEEALGEANAFRATLLPGMATARAKLSAQEIGEKVLAMLMASELDRRVCEQLDPQDYRSLFAKFSDRPAAPIKSSWEHDRDMIGFLGGLQAEIGQHAPRPQSVRARSEASAMNDCEIPTNRKGE
jgi:hypothetical protein